MKVTIQGKTCTCTSTLSVEDIVLVQKYRPYNLVTMDDDGNEIFRIACTQEPSINSNGICFTKDVNGKAYATFTIPDDIQAVEEAKEYVTDILAPCQKYIDEFESAMPRIVSDIRIQRQNQMQNIEVL